MSRNAKHLGMIAGGSGITPMLQIARDILKNKDDKTKISMLYANQTENDILCRNELEEMVNDELGRYVDRFLSFLCSFLLGKIAPDDPYYYCFGNHGFGLHITHF